MDLVRQTLGWNGSCCVRGRDLLSEGEGMTVERRHHRRQPVRLPISFSGSGVSGEGIVEDLSSQGCVVESETRVPEGTVLELQILVPDHYAPTEVERAVVRWTGPRRFGLRFERLSSQTRVRLGRIIRDWRGDAC